MKAFFYLLLLTNLVFLLVQWLYPYEQWARPNQPLAAAERLRLLDEGEPGSMVAKARQRKPKAAGVAAETRPRLSARLCYTLGPFKKKTEAQEVAQRFRAAGIEVSLRPNEEREYMGMMVYLGPHDSRKQAIQVSRELADKGVREYIMFNEPGKMNSLSLGVFGLKKNAERRVAELERLGYRPKTERRYRRRTIYWLDYDRAEPDSLRRWIDKLKGQRGISRITRQCGGG